MRIKVIYIISSIEKALAFEWIVDKIDSSKIDLQFILIGNTETELVNFLRTKFVPHHTISYVSKRDALKCLVKVFFVLIKERPNVIHTHLFIANIIGLVSSWLLRVPKRIHTRHHATYHHQYFPKSVYIDKIVNTLSTDIIVLCENLKKVVVGWEAADKKKIHLIPHGFDMQYFQNVSNNDINDIRIKHAIPDGSYPVIGVISRYTEWKGIQYIIPAFEALLTKYPKAHLILANAQGNYKSQIMGLLEMLPPKVYTEILFEENVAALYKLFDVFVHTPIDNYCEAFGQTYIESLASGIPSVFTLSGIANDFICHEKNALVVDFKNSNQIEISIDRILANTELKNSIVTEGKKSVNKLFLIDTMINNLETLYTKK